MATIGSLVVNIQARTAKFMQSMNKATSRLTKFGRSAKRIGKAVGKAFAAMGAAAAVAIGILVRNSLKSADALAKTADKLGVTTEALAGLQHAANLTGVAQETLNKSLTKQQKALFDADRGLLTYSQHFDALGLSTKDLIKLSPDKQFIEIAGALNKIENQTKKTAIAYDIFGGRGTALLNTLALGAEGLEKATEEAKLFGIALTRIETAKIEMANDQFTRSQAIIKGVGNQITIALTPILAGLNQAFIDAAVQSGGMANFVGKGMNKIVKAVGTVVDSFRKLEIVWVGLKFTFAAFADSVSMGLVGLDDSLTTLINKIPFLDKTTPSEGLQNWALTTRSEVDKLGVELERLLTEPPSSAGIDAWVNDLTFKFEQAAKKIADKQKGAAAFDGGTAETLITGTEEFGAGVLKISDEMKAATSIADTMGFTFSSAFEDAIVEGGKFSDILKGLEKDIIRIITRKLVTEPLAGGISSFISGVGGSFFGGAKANGGPVSAGKSFLVGEKGPELFTPRSNGNITPNDKMGGMSIINNFTIQAPNGTVSRESQSQIAASVGLAVNRATLRNA